MRPDETLDALLARRHMADALPKHDLAEAATSDAAQPEAATTDGSLTLGDLLDAADQFAVWGSAAPSPIFAARLEADLLARFAAPAHDESVETCRSS